MAWLYRLLLLSKTKAKAERETETDGNGIACEKSKAKQSAESVCVNGSDVPVSVMVDFSHVSLKDDKKTRKGLPERVSFIFEI